MASLSAFVRENTRKSLWSLRNVIDCIPDDMWHTLYCGTPLYKHVYHTLHSLDRWYINPEVYAEPEFHSEGLNDLNSVSADEITREAMNAYADMTVVKITAYLHSLSDDILLEKPEKCMLTRLELILGQHRHLDMHIGMLMGYIIAREEKWPKVLGLNDDIKERLDREYD